MRLGGTAQGLPGKGWCLLPSCCTAKPCTNLSAWHQRRQEQQGQQAAERWGEYSARA